MAVQQSGVQPRTHPFAQALRRAIDIRGITLTQLRQSVIARGGSVSVATLSSWRSGARLPEGARSLAVIADIERALGLPEHALGALVGPTRRPGRIGKIEFPWDDDILRNASLEVLRQMYGELPPPTRELSTHSVADVGSHGGITVKRTRSLLQSAGGVITSLPIMEVMPWVAIPQPTIRVVSGGSVREAHGHPSGRIFGAAIDLDQPLTPGATTILETEVEFSPDGPPIQETGHGTARSIRELTLWVRFAPDAIPDWCSLVEDLPDSPLSVKPFPIGRGGSGHVVRAPFGPGALGIHWGRDDPERDSRFRRQVP